MSSRRTYLSAIPVAAFGARIVALALIGAVAGCGGDPAAALPTQKWREMEVQVESRPNPPHPGMNEFLVMVTDRRGRPAYDLIVSLRADDQDEWKQAIQDGQVGVYRRAVRVGAGARSVLQVRMKRSGIEETLYFPLQVQS